MRRLPPGARSPRHPKLSLQPRHPELTRSPRPWLPRHSAAGGVEKVPAAPPPPRLRAPSPGSPAPRAQHTEVVTAMEPAAEVGSALQVWALLSAVAGLAASNRRSCSQRRPELLPTAAGVAATGGWTCC
jgi:hypothetical protein